MNRTANIPPMPRLTAHQHATQLSTAPAMAIRTTSPSASVLPYDRNATERRLVPRRVHLWTNVHDELTRARDQTTALFGHHAAIDRPAHWRLGPDVSNEATTRQRIDATAIRPAIDCLSAIIDRIATEPAAAAAAAAATAPWFRNLFADIGEIWAENEKDRSLIEPIQVQPATLGVEVAANRAFHRYTRQAAPSPAAAARHDPVLEAKLNCSDPRIDVEFSWDTRDFAHAEQRGLPCLVVECKSAAKLRPAALHRVIHRFDAVCTSPALIQRWSDGQGVWLRRALLDDDPPLERTALGVLGALVQLYHAMVRRQQTYGLLTSGHASLLVKIDWSRADEPGQHVFVATLDAKGATGVGCLGRGWSLCDVMVHLAICQLERGLVARDKVDDLIEALFEQQGAYRPPLDPLDEEEDDDASDDSSSDDSDSSDGGNADAGGSRHPGGETRDPYAPDTGSGATTGLNTRRRGRDVDDDADAGSRKYRRLNSGGRASLAVAESSGAAPTTADRIVSRQLQLLRTASAQAEFKKLVELARARACLPVERHHVGRLLCALFPLAPRRRTAAYAQTFAWIEFELDLLRPRTLDCGPVPVDFNKRLAATDDLELTQSMAGETRRLGAHDSDESQDPEEEQGAGVAEGVEAATPELEAGDTSTSSASGSSNATDDTGDTMLSIEGTDAVCGKWPANEASAQPKIVLWHGGATRHGCHW